MLVNIKVTGGLNIESGHIDPKATGGLNKRLVTGQRCIAVTYVMGDGVDP